MEQIKIDVVKQWLINKKEFSTLEVIKTLEKENEQLKAYESHWEEIEEDAKVIAKENEQLKQQIEKMKPYCKELCKNYIKTGFMGNDCYSGVCRNCDKWESAE